MANTATLEAEDYVDWGHVETFATAIGVGECAGVMIDLVSTLVFEAEEKIDVAEESLQNGAYADGIYYAYAAFINTAKALLLNSQVHCNTQTGILKDFDTHFTEKGLYTETYSFKDLVLQINQNEPSEEFAKSYLEESKTFIAFAKAFKESASAVTV